MRRAALLLGLVTFTVGCYTTKTDIRRADPPGAQQNWVIIEKARPDVWAKGIRTLAKDFFVINNIDQATGFVNVSYSGAADRYVAGPAFSYVVSTGTGVQQSRTDFFGTQANARYLVASGQAVAIVNRTMKLEGRANVVVEEMGPTRTRVTVNVRYVLTRGRSWETGGRWVPPPPETETVGFNTGGRGTFSEAETSEGLYYYATGALESELLAAFQ